MGKQLLSDRVLYVHNKRQKIEPVDSSVLSKAWREY